jgi:hypothetical protein
LLKRSYLKKNPRGWLRIGIVLAVVLAFVVSANTIHEHASHVDFLQHCLIGSDTDYCTENYGVPLWAADIPLILFMFLLFYIIAWSVRWIWRGFEPAA